MACGVPVVAPAAGGPLDLIEHGRTGLLYAPGSRTSMQQHVEQLLGDAALRTAIVRSARVQVAQRSWQQLTDELIGHYVDVSFGHFMEAAA